MKKEKLKRSKFYEHFDPIEGTPEDVVKILLNTPQNKNKDWRYLKNLNKIK